MKRKTLMVACIGILLTISFGKIGTVRATEAVPEVASPEISPVEEEESQEEQAKEADERKLCSDIWDEIDYMAVQLRSCYPGSRVEYDREGSKTILYPSGWQKQIVLREYEKATLYYGRYRGLKKYEDYETISPILDAEFFLQPLRALELTTADIDASAEPYQILIEDEHQLELFYTPLFYNGILREDEVKVVAVTVEFDEEYLPKEVRFTLESESMSEERLLQLETELIQQFMYLTEEEFQEHLRLIRNTMEDIVPIEEVTIEDYVNDLNNLLEVQDEYFLQRLTHQGQELSYYSGWDKRAVLAYLEAVNIKFSDVSGNNEYEAQRVLRSAYIKELEEIYQSARQIGSDVYTYMFEASKLKPKKKALLVLRQMGAYLDQNGMLQLGEGDRFDPKMPPHSAFLEAYAQCVRKAYKKGEHNYKRLDDQKIHQFRMYIDKQNIDYVRKNYKGATDYAKLLDYAKSFEMKLFYGEPSRHHNKIERGGRFDRQHYDKILTPNRLSEFIVNVETGEFVTQWDVLKYQKDGTVASGPEGYLAGEQQKQCKIVDTESFNYAPADYVKAHESLDVMPATPNSLRKKSPYLENDVKIDLKELWESPSKKVYRELYKSSKDYMKKR